MGNAPAGVFVGTVIGAVKAGYIALWGEALGRVRFRNALLCISVAYATMFALCLLVAGLMPLPALIVHAVLPLLSGGALLVLHGDHVVSNASKTTPTFDLPVRLFVGIGIFGALISLTNTLSETCLLYTSPSLPLPRRSCLLNPCSGSVRLIGIGALPGVKVRFGRKRIPSIFSAKATFFKSFQ